MASGDSLMCWAGGEGGEEISLIYFGYFGFSLYG